MSKRWWRAYDEAVDDPKLLLLSDRAHRAWFNLMCLASIGGGRLPERKVIEIKLRLSTARTEAVLKELIAAGLLDEDETGLAPHNWNGRQYKSDVSTERVQRFRNAQRNVSETPPENRVQNTDSENKKEGASAPPPKVLKKDRKRAVSLPADFAPDWSAATTVGLSRNEAEREFSKFKNYAAQNGRTCIDWQAAWRNWCIKAAEYLKKPPKNTGPPVAMTIMPTSRSWNAWKSYFRDEGQNGRAAIMDKCADEGRPFTVASEFPPGFEVPDAA